MEKYGKGANLENHSAETTFILPRLHKIHALILVTASREQYFKCLILNILANPPYFLPLPLQIHLFLYFYTEHLSLFCEQCLLRISAPKFCFSARKVRSVPPTHRFAAWAAALCRPF